MIELGKDNYDLDRIIDPKVLESEERFKSYIATLNDNTTVFRKKYYSVSY